MEKKTNKARLYTSPLLEEIMSRITPLEMEQTHNRMLIAARMDDCMKDIGLSKIDLARKLNKQPSEITKWLSGTHNFTMETLTDIAFALNVNVRDLLLTNEDLEARNANMVLHSNNPEPGIMMFTPQNISALIPSGQTIAGEPETVYGPSKEFTPLEKTKTSATADTYNITLKGIELLDSSLVRPPSISPDLTLLKYHIKFEYRIDKEKKLVFIIVHVRIITFPAEAEVENFVVSHFYEIADFDQVIEIKEGDKFSIPQELTNILNDISLSTTRGVMFSTFKGTFLHHAVLPVVKSK
ncbi:MAG: helix-turn-helix domain-containing protein [Saprospiraceae bacterium]|uniref:Helix-turn-helix domain-containing protein n=1 Tax=Candidatus Opimibacter skivensis TaxID=2982028 RepID=A0A9D7STU0_9BACT|nr:helix-turn-helix domain-containing protein [Candidatus Opimibacter skivensis]